MDFLFRKGRSTKSTLCDEQAPAQVQLLQERMINLLRCLESVQRSLSPGEYGGKLDRRGFPEIYRVYVDGLSEISEFLVEQYNKDKGWGSNLTEDEKDFLELCDILQKARIHISLQESFEEREAGNIGRRVRTDLAHFSKAAKIGSLAVGEKATKTLSPLDNLKVGLSKFLGVGFPGLRKHYWRDTGMMPNLLTSYTYSDGHTVDYVRFSTPQHGTKVLPEFERLIQIYEKEEKKFLFCCHQRKHDPFEGKRVDTLRDLQKKYPDTFWFMESDVDGPVFKLDRDYLVRKGFLESKKDRYDQQELFTMLQEAFVPTDEKKVAASPFSLPAGLKDTEKAAYRDQVLPHIMDFVKHAFFPEVDLSSLPKGDLQHKKELTTDEGTWQQFVLLVQIYLTFDLMGRYPEIAALSTPCKDFFDRGINRAMIQETLLVLQKLQAGTIDEMAAKRLLHEMEIKLLMTPTFGRGDGVYLHHLRWFVAMYPRMLAAVQVREFGAPSLSKDFVLEGADRLPRFHRFQHMDGLSP